MIVWKLCSMLQEVPPEALLAVGESRGSLYPEYIFKKKRAKVFGEANKLYVNF